MCVCMVLGTADLGAAGFDFLFSHGISCSIKKNTTTFRWPNCQRLNRDSGLEKWKYWYFSREWMLSRGRDERTDEEGYKGTVSLGRNSNRCSMVYGKYVISCKVLFLCVSLLQWICMSRNLAWTGFCSSQVHKVRPIEVWGENLQGWLLVNSGASHK